MRTAAIRPHRSPERTPVVGSQGPIGRPPSNARRVERRQPTIPTATAGSARAPSDRSTTTFTPNPMANGHADSPTGVEPETAPRIGGSAWDPCQTDSTVASYGAARWSPRTAMIGSRTACSRGWNPEAWQPSHRRRGPAKTAIPAGGASSCARRAAPGSTPPPRERLSTRRGSAPSPSACDSTHSRRARRAIHRCSPCAPRRS